MAISEPTAPAAVGEASISVIICTRNRAGSLKLTLEHLALADRNGIQAEIVVVDNGSGDNTREVVQSFGGRLAVRYLFEPRLGIWGKSYALNRALDEGGLGAIIVVLDDDMTVRQDWFHGVAAICARWPDKDLFTGDTYVIWPVDDPPAWTQLYGLQGGVFSSSRMGQTDDRLPSGYWFLGGHFWFRSRVLSDRRRFQDTWLTEPVFQLDLIEDGYDAVAAHDASVGHRIQLDLLNEKVVMERVRRGGQKAWVRLHPFRGTVRHARLFHEHPCLARLSCCMNYLRWLALYIVASLHPSRAARIGYRLLAVERMTTAAGYLRAAHGVPQYSLWQRFRRS